jgi:hypothetical protein
MLGIPYRERRFSVYRVASFLFWAVDDWLRSISSCHTSSGEITRTLVRVRGYRTFPLRPPFLVDFNPGEYFVQVFLHFLEFEIDQDQQCTVFE